MGVKLKKTLRVVIVENDDNDVFFIERALQKAGFNLPLTRLKDGQYAIDYFSDLKMEARPDLVLLDVQMPRKNGFEVLTWLRGHPLYVKMPVMMLTSSDDPVDIHKAKHLGATEFLTKKAHCYEVIRVLERYTSSN